MSPGDHELTGEPGVAPGYHADDVDAVVAEAVQGHLLQPFAAMRHGDAGRFERAGDVVCGHPFAPRAGQAPVHLVRRQRLDVRT